MVSTLDLILFTVGFAGAVYLINSAIAGEWKKVQLKPLLLYVTSVAMIGVFGEIFWDTLYQRVFHEPLWQYYVLSIHDQHTSYYAVVLWGLYGFYLYLLYDTIHTKFKKAIRYLPLIFSVEALLVEAVVSLAFKLVFGHWLYYYLPNGLWHVSAFQNFPLYLMAGYVIVGTIKRFERAPYFFALMNCALVSVLVFLV